MQALDWHVHTRLRQGLTMDDEARIFTGFKPETTCILVESQVEYDLVDALKLIYGGSPNVFILQPGQDWLDYLDRFVRVFTTWDPFDRNRI